MPEIVFDPVDSITAGAIGSPGRRTFLLQATCRDQAVTVLLEKAQVEVLGVQLDAMLRHLDGEAGVPVEAGEAGSPPALVDAPPLFRALALGLGYEPARGMFVIEARERPTADDEDEGADEAEPQGDPHVARCFVTPAQARQIVASAAEAVTAGRPLCQLCRTPVDPEGHTCPATNGHRR